MKSYKLWFSNIGSSIFGLVLKLNTFMEFVLKKYAIFVFLAIIAGVSFIYNYQSVINLPPYSIHQWRQSDCASFSANYYKENLPFLRPAMLHGGRDGSGKLISEFPIIYYSVGKLWKVFGREHIIFRGINLILVFLGLFFLFKFCLWYFQDLFWATFLPILLFTSPILVYYANNFLANTPAFGLVLIAWYFFSLFIRIKKDKYLILSVIFFCLAGLLKMTALLLFTAILIVFFLEWFNILKIQKKDRIFGSPIKHLSILISPLIIILVWTFYVHYYNELHLNHGFLLQGILPIWEMHGKDIHSIANNLYFNLLPAFINRFVFYLTLVLFVINIIFYKKTNRLYLIISILLFFGVITYLLLFFQVFNVHDYYLINLLIFPVFVFLTSLKLFKEHYSAVFKSGRVKLLFGIALLALVYQTSGIQRTKYSREDKFANSNFLVSEQKKKLNKWFVDYTRRMYIPLEGITPYLRSLGINRNDLVLSVPDFSFNNSLYYMDQRGYTKNSFGEVPLENKMVKFLQMGVKYLIIHEESAKDWDWINPYMTTKIGDYKGVEIYDLREYSR